jgi:DNA-binding PadR family transcriptional regulator
VPRPRVVSRQTLAVLQQLLQGSEAWSHGYDLSRSTGLRSGTLYPILIRLTERGWLEARWAEPERAGRPPRHLYRLTADGKLAAAAAATTEARRPDESGVRRSRIQVAPS